MQLIHTLSTQGSLQIMFSVYVSVPHIIFTCMCTYIHTLDYKYISVGTINKNTYIQRQCVFMFYC